VKAKLYLEIQLEESLRYHVKSSLRVVYLHYASLHYIFQGETCLCMIHFILRDVKHFFETLRYYVLEVTATL